MSTPGESWETKGSVVLSDDALLERFVNDRSLLADIIDVFFDESPRIITDLRNAVAQHDPAAIERAAHSAKGNIRYFAIPEVSCIAERIESSARNGNADGHEEAVASLSSAMERMTTELRRLRKEL